MTNPRPRAPRRSRSRLAGEGARTPRASEDGVKPLRVHIYPRFGEQDDGDGGVRRVVEGQIKYLPKYGIELVDDPEQADLIACHIKAPQPYINRFPRKPIVAMCHGLYWANYEWSNWAVEANKDVMELIRVADAVTAPSEWVASAIRRNVARDITVIPHGIDVDEWQPEENLGYVLWNKTRPDPVCDPEPLNALARIMPEMQFVTTYGDESLRNVTVTGRLPFEQAKKIIQRAGFYLCTTKETFGIGTLEAMAAGVPVVGYRWGGQVDIVREEIDGFLARPDDVGLLSAYLTRAVAERAELSRNAQARAREYTWERAAEAYAALFRRVVAAQTRPAPRTSVIVTNYQLHDYLADCLRSVAAQTDRDWECLVVDDASPNRSGVTIAQAFADKDRRFRVIENAENVYLAEARNIAIRQAQGRYILPLDADDMLAPGAVAALAAALDTDRSIHVAYGRVQFRDEDGVTPTVYDGHESEPGYSGWPMRFAFEQQIRQRNLLPYASMYRRVAWALTGGYRPRCRTAEDADFWTRVSSYGFRPKLVTDEPTLIYRNREGSMSRAQATTDWVKWFPWAVRKEAAPAGAVTATQLPVPAYDRPLVAVIIPVGPSHRVKLKDALDSVDAQSFRDWECIVVNDSGAPLDELPVWARVIETTPTGRTGPAAARNKGVAASRSPLFLPLDADDYLQPNAIEWMLEAYVETRDIIYSDYWENPALAYPHLGADAPPGVELHQDEKGREYWEADYKHMVRFNSNDYNACNLTRGTLHTVTALTPKSAWTAVGGYDESLPAWEDWDFQLKIAEKGICSRRIAAPLFVYRKDTGQRREENVQNFEVSKQGILAKWARLWERGETLMACGSCGGRQTVQPMTLREAFSTNQSAERAGNGSNGAVLVQYVGDKLGNVRYKGASGVIYTFSAQEQPHYVLSQDLHLFQGHRDFRVVEERAASARVSGAPGAPTLVAEGR